jgi:AcrR family transcriptional regulator
VEASLGRRERKKLATRQVIADQAMRLFLDRGYDAVTVAEIADAADVAVSTLFKHFDSKEAIAFARDPAVEAELTRAVRERAPDVSIAQALRDFLVDSPALVAGSPEFVALVRATPALTAYSDRMWSRTAREVAEAIEAETGQPAADMRVRAWTRALVQIPSLVRDEPDREAAIDAAMDVLLHGWSPQPD